MDRMLNGTARDSIGKALSSSLLNSFRLSREQSKRSKHNRAKEDKRSRFRNRWRRSDQRNLVDKCRIVVGIHLPLKRKVMRAGSRGKRHRLRVPLDQTWREGPTSESHEIQQHGIGLVTVVVSATGVEERKGVASRSRENNRLRDATHRGRRE